MAPELIAKGGGTIKGAGTDGALPTGGDGSMLKN